MLILKYFEFKDFTGLFNCYDTINYPNPYHAK